MDTAAAHPTRSRNCLDDEAEDQVAQRLSEFPRPKYVISLESEVTGTAELLVIGVGVAGAGFASACFPRLKSCGKVLFDSGVSTIPVRTVKCNISESRCDSGSSVVVVQCYEPVLEEHVFGFVEQLVSTFPSKRAVIFDTIHKSSFQSDGRTMSPPLVRTLDTYALRNSSEYPTIAQTPLESGNIVEGIAAAASNAFEVRGIQARVVLSLRESRLGTDTVAAFTESLPFLSTCNVQGIIADAEAIKQNASEVRERVSDAAQDLYS